LQRLWFEPGASALIHDRQHDRSLVIRSPNVQSGHHSDAASAVEEERETEYAGDGD